jgi:acyl carrier protein
VEGSESVSRSAQEIEGWIVDRVARLTGAPPQEVDPHEPVRRYGLDSVALVSLVTDLEEWVGYRFTSNPFDDQPTIAALAAFLADETARGR